MKKNKKSGGKVTVPKWIAIVGGIASVAAIVSGIINVIDKLITYHREAYPQYAYEINVDWKNADEVSSFYSSQSNVAVYNTDRTWVNPAYSEEGYDRAVTMMTLYHNLDPHERIITKFTVKATNIVEDLRPVLYGMIADSKDRLTCDIYNDGWGDSGNLVFSIKNITQQNPEEDLSFLELSIKEGAQTSWECQPIGPGEKQTYYLLSTSDIEVHNTDQLSSPALFRLYLSLCAPDHQFQTELSCAIKVSNYGIEFLGAGGQGDEEPTRYVVIVDTSSSTWSETFETYQHLPSDKTVLIPICIAPTKSCTMTVQIEFETMDGEIIKTDILENAKFFVHYYTNPEEYINGSLLKSLNWDDSKGTIVYYPFCNSKTIIEGEIP